MRAVKLPPKESGKKSHTLSEAAKSHQKPSSAPSSGKTVMVELLTEEQAAAASHEAGAARQTPLFLRLLYGTALVLSLLLLAGSISYVSYFLGGSEVFEVSLNGRVAGYAGSNAEILAAVQDFESEVSEALGYPFLFEGDFSYRLVTGRKELTAAQDWRALLYASIAGDYVFGIGLLVDGELLAVLPDEETARTVLAQILSEKNSILAAENETIELRSEIAYKETFCSKETLISENALYLLLTEGDESLSDLHGSLLANNTDSPNRPAEGNTVSGNTVSGNPGIAFENGSRPDDSAENTVPSPDGVFAVDPSLRPSQAPGGHTNSTLPLPPSGNAISNMETGSKHLRFKTVTVVTEQVTESYEVVYRDSEDSWEGTTTMLQAGLDGQRSDLVRLEYADGRLLSRTVLSSEYILEPREEIFLVGTKPRAARGVFSWPLRGIITSTMGFREIFGGTSLHMGLDIDGRTGDDILAADGGVVTFAGWHDSYGYFTIIDHENGYETYYAHQSKLLVEKGDRVYPGQLIGLVGETGNAAGSHLHLELHKDGVAIDPLPLLRAGENS